VRRFRHPPPCWIALAALAVLPGAARAAEAPARVAALRVTLAARPASPIHAGAAYLKETLEAAAPGRVEVQLAVAGPQGNGTAMLADLRRGAAQLAILDAESQAIPAAQLTILPFLFRDPAHRRRVAEGAEGRLLARRIADQSGLAVLGFFASPEHVVATAAGPITRPADLRGMVFRVAPQPVLVEGVRGLEVSAFPLPAPVLYGAAGQRMVAGGHVDLQTVLDLNLHEMLPHLSDSATPFAAGLHAVLADRGALAALPGDLQAVLAEAVQRAARRQMDLAEESRLRLQRELEARGAKFAPLEAAAFRDALRPTWEKVARALKAEDVLGAILNAQ